MSAFVLPLMFLNMFAGLVGGVWLLALGKWQLVVVGLAATFGGAFIVSLLLLPSALLMLPFLRDETVGQSRSTFFVAAASALGMGYTYCVMGAWAIIAFMVMDFWSRNSSKNAGLVVELRRFYSRLELLGAARA